jgi:hypothetical protein
MRLRKLKKGNREKKAERRRHKVKRKIRFE